MLKQLILVCGEVSGIEIRVRNIQKISAADWFSVLHPKATHRPCYQVAEFDRLLGCTDRSLVIGTNSEAIINRAGELVELKKLPRESTTVEVVDDEGRVIRSSRFDVEGVLEEWQIGFLSS